MAAARLLSRVVTASSRELTQARFDVATPPGELGVKPRRFLRQKLQHGFEMSVDERPVDHLSRERLELRRDIVGFGRGDEQRRRVRPIFARGLEPRQGDESFGARLLRDRIFIGIGAASSGSRNLSS